MTKPLRVLIVEDNEDDALLLTRELGRAGYDDLIFEKVSTVDGLEKALDHQSWDIIISDYRCPDFTAPDALEIIKQKGLEDIPFIILSGVMTEDMAIDAMRIGARDCIMKDNLPRLFPVIDRAMKDAEAHRKLKSIEAELREPDATMHRQVEETLQASEKKLRFLIETTSDWVWEIDQNGAYTYASPQVEDILGYNADELIGIRFFEFLPEDQKEATQAFFKESCKIAKPFSGWKLTQKRKDGKPVIIEVNGAPIFDRDGSLSGWIGFDKDITEKVMSEEALKESEEKYRTLIEHAGLSIVYFDTAGVVVLANSSAAKEFGFDQKEDLIGRTLFDLFLGHQSDFFSKRFQKVIKEKVGADFEDLVEFSNEKRWYITNLQPVKDLQNTVVGVLSISSNISLLKMAEEELRRLRNLLRNIIDSMPSVLVGVDRDMKVTQWNMEAEKMTGLGAPEAVGHTLVDVFPQIAGEIEKIQYAMQERFTHKNEKVTTKVGDKINYSDVTVYPLISNGIEGAVIRIDDITERVRIEEMIIQSEKMLSVGGLAAGMAHEINNPLAGILQSVQVIRNRMSGDLAKNKQAAEECGITIEAIESYMEKRDMFTLLDGVMTSGKRAAKIVDNMLSFSRKSDARYALHDLSELLEKTVELASKDYDLKKKYDFRQIEIFREYDAAMPKVMCVGSEIQQVFLNILKNGSQAMAENRDEEEVPQFTLRARHEKDMACIEIEDNGRGMTEEVRKRVFEPFFTTKGVGVGTGLGLSVSYFIITEKHEGTMAVESVPVGGSKFIICLPLGKT